ncbi:MAG: transporter accessory protein [Streptococcus minor]|nr:transporter accessory protein [Streptococcus minor]
MKRKFLVSGILVILSLVVLTMFGFQLNKKPLYDDTAPEFIKLHSDQVVQKIENSKRGVYYFGFANCPWCQELLPYLREELAAQDSTAYLVDTKSADFSEENRQKITDIYIKYLGGDRLYVPFLIVIDSKGELRVHMGTVEGHDASKERMTESQEKEFKNLLRNLIGHSTF